MGYPKLFSFGVLCLDDAIVLSREKKSDGKPLRFVRRVVLSPIDEILKAVYILEDEVRRSLTLTI